MVKRRMDAPDMEFTEYQKWIADYLRLRWEAAKNKEKYKKKFMKEAEAEAISLAPGKPADDEAVFEGMGGEL